MPDFNLNAAYTPTADQPKAIAGLAEGLRKGERFQTLLGATGTGKTFTMAATIAEVQRPALVIAHNKTLAAQLCNEFREFFPENEVNYFVSYYDYYQPEAYVPAQDLYIEKDSSINDEIDRLRHAATASLFARRDVIIVASVSCIYGIGSPQIYNEKMQLFQVGNSIDRDEVLRKLVKMQYQRNDAVLGRGSFRVRGEVLEIMPSYAETAYRISLFGDEIEGVQHFDPLTGEVIDEIDHVSVWPASHYVTKDETVERAVEEIRAELESRTAELEEEGKQLEAHRLRQRTSYDLEMIKELGFTSGIENYSRILDGREPGTPPHTLIDYFPDDFICFVDESHQTIPQIGGMYEGDRSRKQTLVDFGFRLPSAIDNRPLKFGEFLERVQSLVMVSATPGQFEKAEASRTVEQIVRPTGIIDPYIEVRPTRNQIDDLMNEARKVVGHRRADPGHDADQEDGRGPDRLPARVRGQGPLPPLRDRHARTDPDHPRPAARRVRRAGRGQPAARGARPARGVAGGDPRRRQGGLPARRDEPGADDRAGGAKRQRAGADVRRQGDRRDAGGDERDRPPAGDPDRLQRGARDHPGDGQKRHLGDVGAAGDGRPRRPRRRRRKRTERWDSPEELEKTIITLEEEMLAAADDLRFEEASRIRDELKELRRDLDGMTAGA